MGLLTGKGHVEKRLNVRHTPVGHLAPRHIEDLKMMLYPKEIRWVSLGGMHPGLGRCFDHWGIFGNLW